MGSGIQESALEMLGTSRDGRDRALLLDVLAKATDPRIKEAAMEGLMVSGDAESLLKVAKTDADPKVRGEAIELLGAMKATAALEALYKTEKDKDVRKDIIEGMFVARNIDWIANVARNEPDEELRVAAIEMLGPIKASAELLLQVWRSEKSADGKEAVLDALFVQRDAKTLIALAKSETDRKLRRDIIERIALIDSPEAQSFMQKFLEE
jgi:HEAT repeat protein